MDKNQALFAKEVFTLCNAMAKEGNVRLAQEQMIKAKECMSQAAQKYYGSFPVKYYARTGGIETFISPIQMGEEFLFRYGPEYGQGSHRVSNKYIFQKMFMEGYHGGASKGPGHPNPGTLYYRVPVPEYYRWGRAAVQTESPYNLLVQCWTEYLNGEYLITKERVENELIQKYAPQLQALIEKYNINVKYVVETRLTME